MTKTEIEKKIEELPSNDPDFVIGWLIAQLVKATSEESDLYKAYKRYLEKVIPSSSRVH
jgi:hypothetical protein